MRSAGAIVWARLCRCIETELIKGLEEFLKIQKPEVRSQKPEDKWQKTAQSILDDARARHRAAVDAMQKEFAGQMATVES
jgi:hypothetical protein